MNTKFIILIIICFLLINCSGNKAPGGLTKIEIDPSDSSQTGFSDYFELEKYIVLESTDSSLMQDIRKISIINDRIYILTWGQPKIVIFNIDGSFVSAINRYGRGPGEYTYVVDMSVSPGGDTICLYDKSVKKLLYYNLTGEFIRSVDLNTDLETFTILRDNNIVGYSFLNNAEPLNDTIYQLWYFNSEGKILKGFLPVKREYLGNSIGLASTFNLTSSGLFFVPFTENEVYKITEAPIGMVPVYTISFKDKTIPADLLEMPYGEMQKAFSNSYILSGEYIGSKILLFNIYSIAERKNLVAIYNCSSGRFSLINSKNLWDETNELAIQTNQQNHYSKVDRLITIVHPYSLLSRDYKNKQSAGYKLKNLVKETDNPVIVIYKEKN